MQPLLIRTNSINLNLEGVHLFSLVVKGTALDLTARSNWEMRPHKAQKTMPEIPLKIWTHKRIKKGSHIKKYIGSTNFRLNTSKKPKVQNWKDALPTCTRPQRKRLSFLFSPSKEQSCTNSNSIRISKCQLSHWQLNFGTILNLMALNSCSTPQPSSVRSLQNLTCTQRQENTLDINPNVKWNTKSNHNSLTVVTWIASPFERNANCHAPD